MSAGPPAETSSSLAAFANGLAASARSVFVYVLFGTYIGIGALSHDLNFSVGWAMASTVLLWAAPNQVILVTALGAGTVVAALAVVNPGAIIGEASIINTGSIIEHDCRLGDHVHLAPGAVLGGEVVVESLAMIGLGACVLPGVRIGSGSLVAAGALVRSDVPPGCVVAGLPGRVVRRTGLK